MIRAEQLREQPLGTFLALRFPSLFAGYVWCKTEPNRWVIWENGVEISHTNGSLAATVSDLAYWGLS